MAAALAAVLSGCVGQPYVSNDRLGKGLVIVLPGIEGRSPFNLAVCGGLDDGKVEYAIELYDWTSRWGPVANLRNEERNRVQAQLVADRVADYQRAYPGRPVFLVGQSGGGAIAVWAAEALPAGRKVDGVVLLAVALSPGYRLDKALQRSRRGIVSFYSWRDWVFLSVGTKVFATMDGQHGDSAGREGFLCPGLDESQADLYERLFEIGWNPRMAGAGNFGLHLTSGAGEFVRYYVAPLVRSGRWDAELAARLLNGEWVDPQRFQEEVIEPAAVVVTTQPVVLPGTRPETQPTTRPATQAQEPTSHPASQPAEAPKEPPAAEPEEEK
jgi:pimeloyl-ACP methyl ester carboxylesterase